MFIPKNFPGVNWHLPTPMKADSNITSPEDKNGEEPETLHEQKEPKKVLRGWAAVKARDPERFLQLTRNGGKTAQQTGKSHRFTSEEARAAGKKGGASLLRERGPAWFSHIANVKWKHSK